jgi:ParB-like chromosome segregation protein Spo0J
MKDLIRKILREELTNPIRRRIDFSKIDSIIKKHRIGSFQKEEPTELGTATTRTIHKAMYDIMPREFEDYGDEYHKVWDEIKQYLKDKYGEELRQYFEKRQRDVDEDKNPLGIKYIFVKHDKPYYNSGWRGFADGFDSFDEMITKYGNYVDVDWDEIKQKLNDINYYPEPTFVGTMNSRPLKISSVGDEGNTWGYNFSIIKQAPKDNVDTDTNKIKSIQTEEKHGELDEYSRTLKNARKQGTKLRFPKSAIKNNPLRFRPYSRETVEGADPKVGTGKKPEGSDRRLYTDENPSDTVSVKFRTKEDIVDTLNKESFKSKPHNRQSQIINLIHQRVRAAYQNAKDPETKERLKRGLDYIEGKKEQSKQKTIRLQKEGLHDTSWENDKGDKITLMDLLNATEDIPVEKISVEELKPHLLTWDGDEDEVKKIESADLQYPILIFVDNDGEFISIIDGHHRAQKAVRKGLETIKAKIIPINSLPKDIRKVFSHMGKQEQSESKQTNRKDLDFFDLVDKGIIFITEPFGNGKKQKSNWEGDSNIITLWNLKHPEKGQEWVFDAIKYLKPEAIQWWNDEGQFTLKDEKYNQILRSIKMYDNSSKQEQNESELTERCWKGYTQKGMKTMFGKRYPNCVKKTK